MTRPMRVMWFVNKAMPAVLARLELPAQHGGGWMDCQADALASRDDVELAIACAAPQAFARFSAGRVTYLDVGPSVRASRIARAIDGWAGRDSPPGTLARASHVVEAYNPHILHVHGTEYVYGLLAPVAACPTVISLQGLLSSCELAERRGVDSFLLRSLSPRLLLHGSGFVNRQLRIHRAAKRERQILRTCQAFLGRTRFDEDVMRSVNPKARYYHCDEMIRDAFWEHEWQPDALRSHTVFCTAGRYARKGLGTLLRAIGIVRSQGSLNLRLRLAGVPSDPEDRGAVRRAISHHALEACVECLAPLEPKALASELSRASVFALPSHADNSPNSLAEAMLVGTPCVASAVGGVPSLARDYREAILVPDGDPYALAGALLRVVSDMKLATSLSRAATMAARARHDRQTVTEQLLSAYRSELEASAIADEELTCTAGIGIP